MLHRSTLRILALLGSAISINTHGAAARSCDSSTVQDYDPAMAKGAKAFLSDLKAAVQTDNKQQVAAMVAYPLSIYEGRKKRSVQSARDFIAAYDRLFAPAVKKAVAAQSSDCLFANYQGVMIDNGVIWFREERENHFKIVSMNLGAVPARTKF